MLKCSLCGGDRFVFSEVLWNDLVVQWQLSGEEAAYINEQQGRQCARCRASLRVIALGDALRDAWSTRLLLGEFVRTPEAASLRVLDINGCEGLSGLLSAMPGYVRADYPAVDMHALPFESGSFDTVVHSDTLEHVARPIRALEECRRVLSEGGRLCFTVPVVVGRLTRSREGLPKSHHGTQSAGDDLVVHTEFGADAWTAAVRAGFGRVMFNHVAYPAATAISAW